MSVGPNASVVGNLAATDCTGSCVSQPRNSSTSGGASTDNSSQGNPNDTTPCPTHTCTGSTCSCSTGSQPQ